VDAGFSVKIMRKQQAKAKMKPISFCFRGFLSTED
jgi:hypothetical protein